MIKTEKYTITRERLPIHELIGLAVKIEKSTDASKKGVNGIIVDETQRTFSIETTNGIKTIPKNENTFAFTLGNEQVILEGKKMLYTPIERLKNGGNTLYA
ncbi:MAG: ribonuclease P protein subunit [Candidatus Diapherotrites archaeon]